MSGPKHFFSDDKSHHWWLEPDSITLWLDAGEGLFDTHELTPSEVREMVAVLLRERPEMNFDMPAYQEGFRDGQKAAQPAKKKPTSAPNDPYQKSFKAGMSAGYRNGFESGLRHVMRRMQELLGDDVQNFEALLEESAFSDE